jgi:hypothetical protein
MSNPLDAVLSRALSIRLNLQISLSSLPIVEEWMDIHLNRWLESVPLPPEMPRGHTAHFGVVLGSDLSRLTWRAYGDPAGFVPKLASYLEACKIASADAALLDEMGNGLEPELVGSFISVIDESTLISGWQFCDAHPFAAIEPLFSENAAKDRLMAWMERAGVDRFGRFAQAIGQASYSEIEFPIAGVSIDDQLAHVSSAFEALSDAPLPEHVITAMSSAAVPGFAVSVRIRAGAMVRLSVLSPGLGSDMIAELCTGAGVGFHSKMANLQGALRVDGADRVEYARLMGPGESGAQVDIHLIPTDDESPILQRDMN